MQDFKREIAELIMGLAVIRDAGLDEASVLSLIEEPTDEARGDYAFPCFRLAKALKKAPPLIAADLGAQIAETVSAGAGGAVARIAVENAYINFFLDRALFAAAITQETARLGAAYGSSDLGKGKKVIVEFSSPNIAKPFHIGHIRSTVIGSAIDHIYRFLGFETIRINHLGDYGTQFGKMIVAYRRWGSREDVEKEPIKTLLSYYTKFHEEADKDPSLDDEAREVFARLEQGGAEELALWQWFRDESLKEFGRVYKMLGIEFDSYAGESFYSDKMDRVLQEMTAKGLLQESDGAQIVDLAPWDMPPALITKKDGSTLYITRDIAAAIYRKEHYDFYKNIYVVASQQNLHFQQWFKVVALMGYNWASDCVHIPFGLVSLEDGVMSTRGGRVVFLEDVLNKAVDRTREIIIEKDVNTDDIDETARQVGIGAVIFNELANNRIKDYVFSWDKILNFDGETGPYVQYSYARAASVLRKAGVASGSLSDPSGGIEGLEGAASGDYAAICGDEAYTLEKLIYRLPMVVKEAGEKYEPSILTRHLVDIAQAFNRFYHNEHILVEDEKERCAKLRLVAAAKQALRNGLALLGIETPERM
jgi:arginyl-tRNA synthetase